MVGVALVNLGFQVNILALEYINLYLLFYGLLLGCLLVTYGWRISKILLYVCCALMMATPLVGNPLKGFSLCVGLVLGYIAVSRYNQDYCKAMKWLFYINFTIVVIQFLGIWEQAYTFTNYQNQASPIPITEENFGMASFLPQFRPSGIFPSPTYISAFTVLFYSTTLARVQNSNRSTNFCAGVFMSLIGSTLGLFLAIISILLIVRIQSIKYLVAGYMLSSAIYAFYLPQQFDYNFNINEIMDSITSRLDTSAGGGESVMQHNWLIFLILAFFSAVFLLIARRFDSATLLVPPLIAFGLPIMVHDITLSLYYFFLIGSVVASTMCEGTLLRIIRSLKRQKVNVCINSKQYLIDDDSAAG